MRNYLVTYMLVTSGVFIIHRIQYTLKCAQYINEVFESSVGNFMYIVATDIQAVGPVNLGDPGQMLTWPTG
jgi:hypothetical protein